MNLSKKHPPYYVLVGMFLLLNIQKSISCGPGFNDFKGYSLFDYRLLSHNQSFRLENSAEKRGTKSQNQFSKEIEDNLLEWRESVCPDIPIEHIYDLIYPTDLEEIEQFSYWVQGLGTASKKWRKNAFAVHIKKNKCLETMDYLIFAKRCEPFVVPSDPWTPASHNHAEMMALARDAIQTLPRINSHFLRLRYLYQSLRLAHYAGKYENVADWYDRYRSIIQWEGSLIHFWIEGHHAAALRKLNKRIEANYKYLQVFRYCPSKRKSARLSFQLDNQAEWDSLYLKCINKEEQAAMYGLRALARNSKICDDIHNIYDLNPKDEMLEPLLIKAIKEIDSEFLKRNYVISNSYKVSHLTKVNSRYTNKLLSLDTLVTGIVSENKVDDPLFWNLALIYIKVLEEDNYAAKDLLLDIEKNFNFSDAPKLQQFEALKLLVYIRSLDQISPEDENSIYNLMQSNSTFKEYPDLDDILKERLFIRYYDQNQVGKAFRSYFNLADLQMNPNLAVIDSLISLYHKESTLRTNLEESMLIDHTGASFLNKLLRTKGTYLLSQNRLEAAKEVFMSLPISFQNTNTYSPFKEYLGECIHCPEQKDSSYLTRLEIINKIFDLEYQGRANLNTGAKNFYELGNAYYNMSYFGRHWNVFDEFRSGNTWNYVSDNTASSTTGALGDYVNHNLTFALENFEKVIALSKDRELTAKALFMAARCDQKRYFSSEFCTYKPWKNEIPLLPDEFLRYYVLLISEYADTDFYKEIIDECEYLQAYSRY